MKKIDESRCRQWQMGEVASKELKLLAVVQREKKEIPVRHYYRPPSSRLGIRPPGDLPQWDCILGSGHVDNPCL